MLLLKEQFFDSKPEILEEELGDKKVKNHYLSGIMMQSEKLNRNHRTYPKKILETEINRYRSLIEGKRALGELGHPDSPAINLDKVSHFLINLQFEGNDVYGKAKILETPNGRIVKNFINEGIVLGMSSRGLGSVKQINGVNEVQNDFKLAAIDIVAEPSAPDAFVSGLLENKEWIFLDGIYTEKHINTAKQLIKEAPQSAVEEVSLLIFRNFLNTINL